MINEAQPNAALLEELQDLRTANRSIKSILAVQDDTIADLRDQLANTDEANKVLRLAIDRYNNENLDMRETQDLLCQKIEDLEHDKQLLLEAERELQVRCNALEEEVQLERSKACHCKQKEANERIIKEIMEPVVECANKAARSVFAPGYIAGDNGNENG